MPCNVELMALLAEQHWVGAMVPDLATVLDWKKSYLAIWDASIDALTPKPSWKEERRAVIVATFDRLAKVSTQEQAPAPVAKEKSTPKPKPPAKSKTSAAAKAKSTAETKSQPKKR